MLYSVSAGGKRLRPAIMLLVGGDLFNMDKHEGLMQTACSIEMIHTYSLIHDDLPSMDDDDFRRGLPTLHKKYDESVAILAGDALFSLAIETFAKAEGFKDKDKLKGLSFLLENVGTEGMVAGQYVDTKIDNYKRNSLVLKYIHLKKTAAMISASFALPALLSGAKNACFERLAKLGTSAGLLFQIADDIIDVTQSSEVLGKTAGKDLKQNKLTFVSLYGLEKAKRMAVKEAQTARRLSDEINFNTPYIPELIEYFHKRIK
jgi:geranylgeranyl diphosphate synthase type II